LITATARNATASCAWPTDLSASAAATQTATSIAPLTAMGASTERFGETNLPQTTATATTAATEATQRDQFDSL
jgi:hypothetical protein